MTDTEAIDRIAVILSEPEWSPDTLDEIAAVMQQVRGAVWTNSATEEEK